MLGSFYDGFVERAQITPGLRVMDFGAGTGSGALRIAARLDAGGQLYCVDIDPVVLRIAENRTGPRQNVSYHAGDIAAGLLPAESIDLVMIHFVLHDIPVDLRDQVLKGVVGTMRRGRC